MQLAKSGTDSLSDFNMSRNLGRAAFRKKARGELDLMTNLAPVAGAETDLSVVDGVVDGGCDIPPLPTSSVGDGRSHGPLSSPPHSTAGARRSSGAISAVSGRRTEGGACADVPREHPPLAGRQQCRGQTPSQRGDVTHYANRVCTYRHTDLRNTACMRPVVRHHSTAAAHQATRSISESAHRCWIMNASALKCGQLLSNYRRVRRRRRTGASHIYVTGNMES